VCGGHVAVSTAVHSGGTSQVGQHRQPVRVDVTFDDLEIVPPRAAGLDDRVQRVDVGHVGFLVTRISSVC
jgi:hypothetical protein